MAARIPREGDLVVRRYQDRDREPVWALHNSALDAVNAHGGNGPWDDDLHEIGAAYLDAGGEFLVGTLGGQVVAMGALSRTSDERGEIKRMRVDPGCQRRGFGARILAELEERARQLGLRIAHLDTSTQQEAARALYESRGYREVGRGRVGRFETVLYEKGL